MTNTRSLFARPFQLGLFSALLAGFASPAIAIIDQKMMCVLASENTVITIENVETALPNAAPVTIMVGHFDIGNCFVSRILLGPETQVDACAIGDLATTFPNNMDFFTKDNDLITWTHIHGDPHAIPVEIMLDCTTTQGLE